MIELLSNVVDQLPHGHATINAQLEVFRMAFFRQEALHGDLIDDLARCVDIGVRSDSTRAIQLSVSKAVT